MSVSYCPPSLFASPPLALVVTAVLQDIRPYLHPPPPLGPPPPPHLAVTPLAHPPSPLQPLAHPPLQSAQPSISTTFAVGGDEGGHAAATTTTSGTTATTQDDGANDDNDDYNDGDDGDDIVTTDATFTSDTTTDDDDNNTIDDDVNHDLTNRLLPGPAYHPSLSPEPSTSLSPSPGLVSPLKPLSALRLDVQGAARVLVEYTLRKVRINTWVNG